MTVNPVDALVSHVADREFDDLPVEAVDAAKTLILDTFSIGVAGVAGAGADDVLRAARSWGSDGPASVWGRDEQLTPSAAAVVNAYQIHCLEYDCVHETAVLHPMTPLMAALFAEAQRLGNVDGQRFVSAIVLAVDISCNIALASQVPSPFFRTGSVNAFAATAACARLRGFDNDTIHNAMGIVFEQMCGARQAHTEGTRMMGLLAGFAARNALVACDLAEQGVIGPKDFLVGPYGYFNLFEGAYELEPMWSEIGSRYRMSELAQKPFPSGRPIHICIDAAQRLMREHGFSAEDIAGVVCRVTPTVQQLVGRPDQPDPDPNYAKLCTAYCVATTFCNGTLTQRDFDGDALRHPEIHKLAERIQVVADDNPDPNAIGPSTVEVTLNNGDHHSSTVEFAPGHPHNAMNRDQRLEKFWFCWRYPDAGPGDAKGDALIDTVDHLETLDNVSELADLVTA